MIHFETKKIKSLCLLVAWFTMTNVGVTDVIKTFDGSQHLGTITSVNDGSLKIKVTATNQELEIPIQDATAVAFDSLSKLHGPDIRLAHPLLSNQSLSQVQGIPLRKGNHKLVIVHNGKTPTLSFAAEGKKKKKVTQADLCCPQRGYLFTPSTGLDSEGFRLPDSVKKVRPGLTYRLYRSKKPIDMRRITEFKYQYVKAGRFAQFVVDWPSAKTHLGIFTTMIKIPEDGLYRFWLENNQDAWLYMGNLPVEIQQIVDSNTATLADDSSWQVELAGKGIVSGEITAWTQESLTIETSQKGIPPLQIPLGQVTSLANLKADIVFNKTIARQADRDTIVAAVAQNRSTSIAGKILGIEGDLLVVQYEGKARKVALQKVIKVMMRHGMKRPNETYQLARIAHNQILPVKLTGVGDSTVLMNTVWGQELKVGGIGTRTLTMVVQNGRLQYLSDIAPVKVEQIPYFDRTVNWQANRSISGGPLVVGTTEYEHGLAMHSKTKLTYELAGAYERFMATVGIDPRMKRLGNVALQIEADGQVLYNKDQLQGSDDPLPIDIQIGGAKRLTLITDFGEGQDVGDQVNWANARLVKSAAD